MISFLPAQIGLEVCCPTKYRQHRLSLCQLGLNEAQMVCRLTTPPSNTMGIVEHHSENDLQVVVAATLTQLNHQEKFLVRCLNAKDEPVTIRAGTTLGLYTPITSDDIFQHNGNDNPTKCQPISESALPAHMLPLYERACPNCETSVQKEALASQPQYTC